MNSTTQEGTQPLVDELVGVSHGDFGRVKEIVEAHPELVNSNAAWVETPIQAAAQMGRVDIARYLLEKGAPLDICTAAMLGMEERVGQFLSEDPAQRDAAGAHGLPVMWFPAVKGHTRIAQMLLDAGADVNAGAGSNTPLHGAAGFGQQEMVEWLLKQGADPWALDYEGKTPAQVAEQNGQAAISQLLTAA